MATSYTAYVSETLLSDSPTGNGQVIVVRKKSPNKVEAGYFLVDLYCLGVYDAFLNIGTEAEFMGHLEASPYPFKEYSGEFGRKLIEEALAYAKQFGFVPPRDYKKAARVFGGLKAADSLEGITFGKNGKPFYMQPQMHDRTDAERILRQLVKRCGDDGFTYLLADDFDDDDDESLLEEDDNIRTRIVLTEIWLSPHSDTSAEHPSQAAQATFREFAERYGDKRPELLGETVWANPGDADPFDGIMRVLAALEDQLAKHSLEEDQSEIASTLSLPIAMVMMTLIDLDEEDREECFKMIRKDPTFDKDFDIIGVLRGAFANETLCSACEDFIHPVPSVTLTPLSIESVDDDSDHFLLICKEESYSEANMTTLFD